MLTLVSIPAQGCIGARQAAMGWAGVAISDDATASYWNPATFPWARNGLFCENIYDNIAIALKHDEWGFAFADQYDKTYFEFSHSFMLSSNTAIGIAAGWHADKRNEPNIIICDGYILVPVPQTIANLYNGPMASVSFISVHDYINFGVLLQGITVRPGICLKTDGLAVSGEIYDLFGICDNFHYRFGVEFTPVSFLSLRGGYNSEHERVTYGVGIRASFVSIDMVHYYDDENYYSVSLFY